MKKIIALVLALVMVLSLSTVAFAYTRTLASDILDFVRKEVVEGYNDAKREFNVDVKAWNGKVLDQGGIAQRIVQSKLNKVAGVLKQVGFGINSYLHNSVAGVSFAEDAHTAIDDAGKIVWNNYNMISGVIGYAANHIQDALFYVFGLPYAGKPM